MNDNNPTDKVRELQRKLFTAAKCNRKRVRANRGAAGVDGETLALVEASGMDSFLESIQQQLREGKYRPSPVRRQYIRKPDGRQRPLGTPTVRDRVVQQATKLVLEPMSRGTSSLALTGLARSAARRKPKKSCA